MVSGMPDTISITSSAWAAAYWFIQPCMSVNFRCSSFSEVPPIPISLVTKMKVASCAVKRSNSALAAASARSVSDSRSKKKLVHHRVMQSIRTTRPSSRWRLSSFSSSMFVHSGPRRSWCRITLGGILRPRCVPWQDKREWERARVPAFPHRCFCRNVLLR